MNDKHERPELFPWEMTAREFRATLTICKAAYGSRRWTAQDRNGQTVYFVPRPFVSAQGQAIYPGMGPCCFERKRDLLAAMDELHCAAVKYALRSGKSLCAAVRAEYPLLFPPLDEDMPFRPCCGCGYCCAKVHACWLRNSWIWPCSAIGQVARFCAGTTAVIGADWSRTLRVAMALNITVA